VRLITADADKIIAAVQRRESLLDIALSHDTA
jgi:hypothetical protein